MNGGEKRFRTTVTEDHGVVLPFDPDEVWGRKERHHVTGSVNGIKVRGELRRSGVAWSLPLGPAWRRDTGIGQGDAVEVVLAPEGPRASGMGEDVAAALAAETGARAFFESLPTFYRNNFARWIASAKRPETRARRIEEMVALLKAGRRQR